MDTYRIRCDADGFADTPRSGDIHLEYLISILIYSAMPI